MTVTYTKLLGYEVRFTSGTTTAPRIWLYGKGGLVGQLIFVSDETPLTGDSVDPNGNVNLYYHREALSALLELLRAEKDIYLMWQGPGTLVENGIKTNAISPGS